MEEGGSDLNNIELSENKQWGGGSSEEEGDLREKVREEVNNVAITWDKKNGGGWGRDSKQSH